MALTLAANIDAEQTTLEVTGTVDADIGRGYLFRIGTDAELLELRDFGRTPITTPIVDRARVGRDPNAWIVRRGENATSHTSGASIKGAADAYVSGSDETEPGPFPSGGGTITPMPFIAIEDCTPEALRDALISAGLMEAS